MFFFGEILLVLSLTEGDISKSLSKKETKKRQSIYSSLAYEFDYTQPVIAAVRQHAVKCINLAGLYIM